MEPTGGTPYHVSPTGNDTHDGLGWDTAVKTIGAAIARAGDGDTILVTNGLYNISAQLTLDKALTLVGVNGREVTEIQGNNSFRLLYIDNPYARVSGFTFSQGRNKSGAQGGGFAIGPQGGSVEACRVTGCNSDWWISGSAVYQSGGLVSRCLIDNNSFGYGQSGTVYLTGGLIENCVIADNQVHRDGGGLYMTGGVARNCTITGNEASRDGCGVYRTGSGRIENCIVWGNIHRITPNLGTRDFYGATAATVSNCCSPVAVGSAPVTAEPLFIDASRGDYRLQAGSPCIDAGATAVNTAATDLGGTQRVIGTAIDIGAHEFDTSRLACGFVATPAAGLAPLPVTLVPTVHGTSTDTSQLKLVWQIDRGVDEPLVVTNTGLQNLACTLEAGWHTVTLEVTDPLSSATAIAAVTNAVGVSPATLYVDVAGTNARAPFATWATAATNLHTAVALAADGATIRVANGTYPIVSQLLLTRAVTLQSTNGYASTIIQAPQVSGVRLILSHADARVEGFTMRGGASGNGAPGGGVLITGDGGTLYNCRVTGNRSQAYDGFGAGIHMIAGRVARCVIDANHQAIDSVCGGGVYHAGGILENCLILTNTTYSMTQNSGGGVYFYRSSSTGLMRNCTLVGNRSGRGGGVYVDSNARIQNCIIVNNVTGADTGAGAPNWFNSGSAHIYQNICTPATIGTGCITADPLFVDADHGNYQLRLGSPCIDAGLVLEDLPPTDLAGNPRISGNGLDIGAFEYDARVLSCGVAVDTPQAVESATVWLSSTFFGFDAATNELHFAWSLDDTANTPLQSGFGLHAFSHTFTSLGRYHVKLTISEPASGHSVSSVLSNAVHIAPAVIYVVPANPAAAAPYNTPAKAATNIHEAVREAVGGSTVMIAAGTYAVTETILLNQDITMRGVDGMARTVLAGNKVPGVRIFEISAAGALVENFTIRGGHCGAISMGGGVQMVNGTLRSCLITDNAVGGYSRGAGINLVGGLVSGCIISNNVPCESGGGLAISGGICENSLITASHASYGGGVMMYGGVLRNCTLSGNTATTTTSADGGGGLARSIGGTIINCIIWGNTASNTSIAGYPDWSGAHATAYQYTCTPVAVGEHAVVADPRFKDAARQDYRLTPRSPCRDKGLYQEWMAGARDLWGNPRVDVRQYVDIGAHEEQSSLATMMILR